MNRNRLFLLVLVLGVLVLGCWYFKKILFYLLAALFLTLLALPLKKILLRIRIAKYHLPPGLAALLTLFSLYALFAGLFAIFLPLLAEEARIISHIDPNKVVTSLQQPIHATENFINTYSSDSISLAKYAKDNFSKLINAGGVTSFANTVVGFTGDLFIAFFAISFFTFFFLKDGKSIFESVMMLSPPKYENDIREISGNCKHLLSRYFIGICIDVVTVTLLISLGLYLVGVRHAFIIGFFAGIMNVIPYVGPFISATFGIVVTLSSGLDLDFSTVLLPMCERMVLVFVAVNLLDAFIVQPLIFSSTVRAHPLEIFLVVMIAGTLADIPGMILAVPAYTVLRVIAKQFFSRFKLIHKMTQKLDQHDTEKHA